MVRYPKLKAAAAHVAPVYFDIDATIDKACSLIAEAARRDVQLIAFPESFVPGYPHWGRLVALWRVNQDETSATIKMRFYVAAASRLSC